jgi:hypothetical protein
MRSLVGAIRMAARHRGATLRNRRRFRKQRNLHINVGCGPHPLQGWVNVDIIKAPEIVCWDCRRSLPFEDESAAFIFAARIDRSVSVDGSGPSAWHRRQRSCDPKQRSACPQLGIRMPRPQASASGAVANASENRILPIYPPPLLTSCTNPALISVSARRGPPEPKRAGSREPS